MASDFRWRCAVLLLSTYLLCVLAAESKDKPKKKKDIRDYNDADMARLLEQWEEDDDIEEGDLPEHKRSPPPIDFSKVDASKPEELLKMSKKGRTLMVFATVSGDPTEKETEEITGLWQGSLFNANYDIQRDALQDGVPEVFALQHLPIMPVNDCQLHPVLWLVQLPSVHLPKHGQPITRQLWNTALHTKTVSQLRRAAVKQHMNVRIYKNTFNSTLKTN
uniref:LRP chaperone MESD n=1 Tax=Sparus aurata TaxID=8175 RepID=A0A671TQ82_SPAAU